MRRSSWRSEVVTRGLKGRRGRWPPLKGSLVCCWRGEALCLRAIILRRLSTRRRGLAVLAIFSVQTWRRPSLRWSCRLCFVLPRGVSPFVVNYRPQIHCSDKSVVPGHSATTASQYVRQQLGIQDAFIEVQPQLPFQLKSIGFRTGWCWFMSLRKGPRGRSVGVAPTPSAQNWHYRGRRFYQRRTTNSRAKVCATFSLQLDARLLVI